jgi:4a-hydroxytetrahydrobiopterin dehydratase
VTGLADRSCVPCRGGVPPLPADRVRALLAEVPGWSAPEDRRLERRWKTKDFASALALVNRIGALAEAQGHHPDLSLGWGRVEARIWTHAIGGLTESDFVLAAKIDRLTEASAR